MSKMIDVVDYMRRLFSAVFLCPVALSFWFMFGMAGFNLMDFFALCGNLGQRIAAMNPEEYAVFMVQFLGGWGSLAFLFLLMTFAFNPPKFNYALKREGDHHRVSVMS